MTKSENIKNLIIALHKFQGEAKPVVKDSTNPFYKSRYADLSAIIEATQEGLSKNGLAIIQTTDINAYESGANVLETTLCHISGEWITGRYVLTPNKPNDPQAMGSALSYARRYNISAILNLATTDDDGEKAMARTEQTTSEQMLTRLGEIKNIFELKNWWTKHEAEIKSLPAELKAQVVKTKEKIKLKLEGKGKPEKDVPLNPGREPGEEG